jgi:hypothetical protein
VIEILDLRLNGDPLGKEVPENIPLKVRVGWMVPVRQVIGDAPKLGAHYKVKRIGAQLQISSIFEALKIRHLPAYLGQSIDDERDIVGARSIAPAE